MSYDNQVQFVIWKRDFNILEKLFLDNFTMSRRQFVVFLRILFFMGVVLHKKILLSKRQH